MFRLFSRYTYGTIQRNHSINFPRIAQYSDTTNFYTQLAREIHSSEKKKIFTKEEEVGKPIDSESCSNSFRSLEDQTDNIVPNFFLHDSFPELLESVIKYAEVTKVATGLSISGAIGFGIRFYQVNSAQKKEIHDRFYKLNELIFKIDKLKNDIQESYHDAYTVIKPEERMKATQVRKLERDTRLIISELREFISDLEKRYNSMKIRHFLNVGLAKSCNEKIKLAKTKMVQIESYYYIAESVFHCQIKNHKDAYTSIMQALEKYIEIAKIDSYNHEEHKMHIDDFKNLYYHAMFEKDNRFYNKDDEYCALYEVGIILEKMMRSIALFYKQDHQDWYGDVLTYLGYVIFDSFNQCEQITYLSLFPAYFSLIATKVNPNNHIAYSNVGFVYAKLGHLDKARPYIEKSMTMNRLFPLSRFNRGILLLLLNKDDKNAEMDLILSGKIIAPHFDPKDGKREEKIDALTPANISLLDKIKTLLHNYDHKTNDFYRENKSVPTSVLEKLTEQSVEQARKTSISWVWDKMSSRQKGFGTYKRDNYPVMIEMNTNKLEESIGVASLEYRYDYDIDTDQVYHSIEEAGLIPIPRKFIVIK